MIYKAKTNRKMKAAYLLLLPLLVVMTIMSCQKTKEAESTTPPMEEKSEVLGFAEADQPPLFPECDANASLEEQTHCFQKGIFDHIKYNFKYPEKAEELEMEGKIYVKFIVTEGGEIDLIEIMRGLSGETQAEIKAAKEANQRAVDLVQGLPKMAPALKEGKAVPVSFIMPINLKLS